MRPRSRRSWGVLVLLGGLVCSVPACDALQGWLDSLTPAGFPAFDAEGVRLRLENQSGVALVVEATFEQSSQDVRKTTRRLGDSGAEAVQTVLWTRVERILVTATIASDAVLPSHSALHPGDQIAAQEFRLGVHFMPGATVSFIVPPIDFGPLPITDCNNNGIDDALDLVLGASPDCNGNGVPDDCDVIDNFSDDTNRNGIPDECETGACCFSDGACVDKTLADCAAAGGTTAGLDTSCQSWSCPPPPTVACCFTNGYCSDLTVADCREAGGNPRDEGTSCETASCTAPPTEACCYPYADFCLDEPTADCLATWGEPQGPGTTCQTTTCPAAS